MVDSTVKEEKHITYDAIKIGLASPASYPHPGTTL